MEALTPERCRKVYRRKFCNFYKEEIVVVPTSTTAISWVRYDMAHAITAL
jgi:hypothetical protein